MKTLDRFFGLKSSREVELRVKKNVFAPLWALPVILVDATANLEAALVLLLVQRDRDGETLDGGARLVAKCLVRHQSEKSVGNRILT